MAKNRTVAFSIPALRELSEQGRYDQLLLSVLILSANDAGLVDMSIPQLMKASGLTERTTLRTLASLVSNKWIGRRRIKYNHNRYDVDLAKKRGVYVMPHFGMTYGDKNGIIKTAIPRGNMPNLAPHSTIVQYSTNGAHSVDASDHHVFLPNNER